MSDTAQPLSGHTEDLREIKRDVAAIRALLMEDNGSGRLSMQTRLDRLEQAHATHSRASWIVATVAIGHAFATLAKRIFT